MSTKKHNTKSSSKSSKSEKSNHSSKSHVDSKTKQLADTLMRIITQKPNHYTKTRLNEKFEKFGRSVVAAAREYLWEAGKLSFHDGKYLPKVERE